MLSIRYVNRAALDVAQWDRCIASAPNGLLYAYAMYLDGLTDGNWHALVAGNYEAVMPLCFRRKYGVYYLYQPYFIPCLGVFGAAIDADDVAAFLAAIPAKFRYWDISLNHGNWFPLEGWPVYRRVNYVLPLWDPYPTLQAAFRPHIGRNVQRAVKQQCSVTLSPPLAHIIELANMNPAAYTGVTAADFDNFARLFTTMEQAGNATTRGVTDAQGRLVSAAAFVFGQGRATYMLSGTHPDGKTLGASHLLLDSFIRDYAGSPWLLDFEGSDVPGLAFFYSSFGARTEYYAGLRLNRLPLPFRWLKR